MIVTPVVHQANRIREAWRGMKSPTRNLPYQHSDMPASVHVADYAANFRFVDHLDKAHEKRVSQDQSGRATENQDERSGSFSSVDELLALPTMRRLTSFRKSMDRARYRVEAPGD
jgi:hypothetical protein